MIFAIQEINEKKGLLPNVTIGYRIYDNCASTLSSMRSVMALMNGDELTLGNSCSGQSAVHAVIGESESSSTVVLSRTTGPFQIPVVRGILISIYVSMTCNILHFVLSLAVLCFILTDKSFSHL
ncbi:hypothetical protein ILYODFUR_027122 [Ilyodon furcidens]|uniref:Receptor ligand binding region domain-containing protein n=1 Tax=Ilyodon furcidens TaxID=33524 RepID=A0ABV0UVP1_9TELE